MTVRQHKQKNKDTHTQTVIRTETVKQIEANVEGLGLMYRDSDKGNSPQLHFSSHVYKVWWTGLFTCDGTSGKLNIL